MNASDELTQFLQQHIPAAKLLGIYALTASQETVQLFAPFELNKNHHQSIFGGSGALLATLCAWSLVHLNFPEVDGNIVIRQSSIEYDKPALSDLTAVSTALPSSWQKCQAMLQRFGKGSVTLSCQLVSGGQVVGQWQGQFVVVKGV